MNDTSNVIFFKDRIECSAVTDVIFIENEILSRNLLDAFKGFFTGIDQVVDGQLWHRAQSANLLCMSCHTKSHGS